MRFDLRHGDSREVLPLLDAASVDALVTDPPAGIGFMGKDWDDYRRSHNPADVGRANVFGRASRVAPEIGRAREGFKAAMQPIFEECLRVLKPGAHGLVWAIPRTSHWTATALEDAGFEIRDIVVYLHGQGFPKNLNVSKSINRCACGPEPVRQSVRGVRADLHSEGGAGLQQVEAVQRSLLREMALPDPAGAHAQDRVGRQTRMDEREPSLLPREDERREQSGVEGRGDTQADARELSGSEVRSLPAGVSGDGATRRVRDGASACDGAADRADPPADGSSPPRGSQPGEQCGGESVALARQSDAQAGGAWPRCTRCGLPVVPDGLGTALKPSMENWILVRKPLDGTVAANVAAHGTGALNIDACRLVSDDALVRPPIKRTEAMPSFGRNLGLGTQTEPGGRWPANVTLDEEAAALLDAQSGELTSGAKPVGTPAGGRSGGIMGAHVPRFEVQDWNSDSGGASRFFYVAKPDRGERDIGCEDLPAVSGGTATDRKDGSAGTQNPRAGAGRNGGARNIHPTVKSVDLMRWLCRLVTPRGGLVLDPFMGSGSTGIACAREGMRFIGIEREQAYFEIARRRIVGDAPLLNRIGQLQLEGPDNSEKETA